MSRIWFQPPVKVATSSPGLTVQVRSVERAANALLDWPEADRGPKWQLAAAVCMSALKGEASPEEARAAFEEAARESGKLIET